MHVPVGDERLRGPASSRMKQSHHTTVENEPDVSWRAYESGRQNNLATYCRGRGHRILLLHFLPSGERA